MYVYNMIRDAVDINDFIIITEVADVKETILDSCKFEEPVVAVAFYGSGNVDLSIKYGDKVQNHNNTNGLALSFYADGKVEFEHTVSPEHPLRCLLLVSYLQNLENHPNQEGELFEEMLNQLVNPQDHYVEAQGSSCLPICRFWLISFFQCHIQEKPKCFFLRVIFRHCCHTTLVRLR